MSVVVSDGPSAEADPACGEKGLGLRGLLLIRVHDAQEAVPANAEDNTMPQFYPITLNSGRSRWRDLHNGTLLYEASTITGARCSACLHKDSWQMVLNLLHRGFLFALPFSSYLCPLR